MSFFVEYVNVIVSHVFVTSEAEYTFRLRKRVIPLRLQVGYYPDGWLGALTGSKLVFDCSLASKLEESVRSLIRELGNDGKLGCAGDSKSLRSRRLFTWFTNCHSDQGWQVFARRWKKRVFRGKNRTGKNSFCRQK